MPLRPWMRAALLVTAVMNFAGALAFAPVLPSGRELLHLPGPVHPIYLWIIAELLVVFGVGYAWCGLVGRAPRLFIAVGAIGKLGYAATLFGSWLGGQISRDAAMGGVGDVVFGCVFLAWLYQVRGREQAR